MVSVRRSAWIPTILAATPIYQALGNFLKNVFEQDAAIREFTESYGADDEAALVTYLEEKTVPRRVAAANAVDGFHATVTAIKANESIVSGQRIVLKDEWYQL